MSQRYSNRGMGLGSVAVGLLRLPIFLGAVLVIQPSCIDRYNHFNQSTDQTQDDAPTDSQHEVGYEIDSVADGYGDMPSVNDTLHDAEADLPHDADALVDGRTDVAPDQEVRDVDDEELPLWWLWCGDDLCNAAETCSDCPEDCGSCCGNGECNAVTESCATCPADCGSCCPNGTCDYGETACTCTSDCGLCSGCCDSGSCVVPATILACGKNGDVCAPCAGPQDECMGGACACQPACSGKVCGADGCGGACGACSGPQDECIGGQCVCQPDCNGKQCGDDGCGGSCGVCSGVCTAGQCCVPDCTGRECGDDGCGGSCGACATSDYCAVDHCLALCGNSTCADAEDCATCPADCGSCCPNGFCDNGESCDSCAEDCGGCVTPGFVLIPAGSFWMGTPDGICPSGYPGSCTSELGRNPDETLHYVTLTHSFEIQVTEVTQGEWKAAYGAWNPSYFPSCGDTCPVEQVNWYESVAYANAKSLQAGKSACYAFDEVVCHQGGNPADPTDYAFCMDATHAGIDSATVTLNGVAKPYECMGYRLPTESEWEYAYRAGGYTAFYTSFGNDGIITYPNYVPLDMNLDKIGWYGGNITPYSTKPVGGKAANAWGLKDLSGNVYEWTWDRYDTYPTGTVASPNVDPAGASSGSNRTGRGGSWSSNASYCRSGYRDYRPPDGRSFGHGCRLSRTTSGFCVPECVGNACGDNGCGENCGVCIGLQDECIAGQCVCVPNCTGKECGDDGCGGTCAPDCSWPESCTSGHCVAMPCEHPAVVQDCSGGWCFVPAGCFEMGAPDEDLCDSPGAAPRHEVWITRPFLMKQYFVTVNDAMALMWNVPAGAQGCGTGDCPLMGMVWDEAVLFANQLSQSEGLEECYVQSGCTGAPLGYSSGGAPYLCNDTIFVGLECTGYRLPTEAEYEYATRAGTTSEFYGGALTQTGCSPVDPVLSEIAWYCGNNPTGERHPAGGKAPNGWGLYDMVGNVSEMVHDRCYREYMEGYEIDPICDDGVNDRCVRRGSAGCTWPGCYACDATSYHRLDYPNGLPANYLNDYQGFRLVRTLSLCVPSCGGRDCGGDGCGGVCGACSGPLDECIGGQCVCQPDCSGKQCGDNGCGGSCGVCIGLQDECIAGQCVCVPNCTGRECGDDGCGGSCGGCSLFSVCTEVGVCSDAIETTISNCSGGQNPCGRWFFGSAGTSDGTFVLYDSFDSQVKGVLWQWFGSGNPEFPVVIYNPTDEVVHCDPTDDCFPPHAVAFHPAYGTVNSVIEWRCDEAATYMIAGFFKSTDSGTKLTRIYLPSSMVAEFAQQISGGQTAPFTISANLLEGERVRFAVDNNGGIFDDQTQISVQISKTN